MNKKIFRSDTYWYVTIIGPHVGAVLGAWIYVFLIERMRSKSELKSQSTILSELVKPKKSNRCKFFILLNFRYFSQKAF